MNRLHRRALARLEALPPDLLADAIEQLVDRLDAIDAPFHDLEPETDACEAEDVPHHGSVFRAAGDADDAEDDDPPEPSLSWSSGHDQSRLGFADDDREFCVDEEGEEQLLDEPPFSRRWQS